MLSFLELDPCKSFTLRECFLVGGNLSIQDSFSFLVDSLLFVSEGTQSHNVYVEDKVGASLLLVRLHQDKRLILGPVDLHSRKDVADRVDKHRVQI